MFDGAASRDMLGLMSEPPGKGAVFKGRRQWKANGKGTVFKSGRQWKTHGKGSVVATEAMKT